MRLSADKRIYLHATHHKRHIQKNRRYVAVLVVLIIYGAQKYGQARAQKRRPDSVSLAETMHECYLVKRDTIGHHLYPVAIRPSFCALNYSAVILVIF